MKAIGFDKYQQRGAYHWKECAPSFKHYVSYNPALVARYKIVVDHIRSVSGGRLLDVGCGEGYLIDQLAGSVEEAIGIDSEAEAIRIGSELLSKRKNCSIRLNVCYELPFEDVSFDWVTSTDVIEHLEDPNQHLAEILRVLKPGGTLVLTTPQWRPDRKWDERHVKEFKAEELDTLIKKYFGAVETRFFWPSWASRLYETKIGWRALKISALLGFNPFARSGNTPGKFGQIFACCTKAPSS